MEGGSDTQTPVRASVSQAMTMYCAPCVCVWSHCTMLRLRGIEGVGVGGGLKDDKVQAHFDPQPTCYAEVLSS